MREIRKIIVTGGAGFIGSNFIAYVLEHCPECSIVNIDALTYAGSLANLSAFDTQRHYFIHADIRDVAAMNKLMQQQQPDSMVNFAAESHVDRSIDAPLTCVATNVLGTASLLEAVRHQNATGKALHFHHISTDEVHGSLGPVGKFLETSPLRPSSPYSASKAGADHLVNAYHHTYGMDITISSCSNNYGPRQLPEKLLPRMLCNALTEKPLPLYGDGNQVRDWLYVEDHAAAIWAILTKGQAGRSYNIGGDNELSNISLVRTLCAHLDTLRPRRRGSYADLIAFVADRPGHDVRYAIDSTRIRSELGWSPAYCFEKRLLQTIHWYLDHPRWIDMMQFHAEPRYGLGEIGSDSAAII